MADFRLLWEDDQEREIVEKLRLDWLLYGEIHMTNANGLTRLDPRDITYTPPRDGPVGDFDSIPGVVPIRRRA